MWGFGGVTGLWLKSVLGVGGATGAVGVRYWRCDRGSGCRCWRCDRGSGCRVLAV